MPPHKFERVEFYDDKPNEAVRPRPKYDVSVTLEYVDGAYKVSCPATDPEAMRLVERFATLLHVPVGTAAMKDGKYVYSVNAPYFEQFLVDWYEKCKEFVKDEKRYQYRDGRLRYIDVPSRNDGFKKYVLHFARGEYKTKIEPGGEVVLDRSVDDDDPFGEEEPPEEEPPYRGTRRAWASEDWLAALPKYGAVGDDMTHVQGVMQKARDRGQITKKVGTIVSNKEEVTGIKARFGTLAGMLTNILNMQIHVDDSDGLTNCLEFLDCLLRTHAQLVDEETGPDGYKSGRFGRNYIERITASCNEFAADCSTVNTATGKFVTAIKAVAKHIEALYKASDTLEQSGVQEDRVTAKKGYLCVQCAMLAILAITFGKGVATTYHGREYYDNLQSELTSRLKTMIDTRLTKKGTDALNASVRIMQMLENLSNDSHRVVLPQWHMSSGTDSGTLVQPNRFCLGESDEPLIRGTQ